MGYIFDITSNIKNRYTYNVGTNIISSRLKFDGSDEDKVELLKLAKSCAKVLTTKVRNVRYANNKDQSYTDGKDIVISSVVDKDNYDSTIGLVLHEASHIAITDFFFWNNKLKNLPKEIKQHTNLIKDIWNWVEDRRIDSWAYNEAIGYKKYYEALYYRYFITDKIKEVIDKKGDKLKEETINNYMFYLMSSITPYVKMNELKGLPQIKDILDIDNISRLESTKQTYELSIEIYKIIIDNIKEDDEYNKDSSGDLCDVIDNMSDDELEDLISGMLDKFSKFGDHEIDDDEVVPLSPSAEKRINEILDKFTPKEFKESEHNKQNSPINKQINQNFNVKVYTNISDNEIKNSERISILGRHNTNMEGVIKEGKKIGNSLRNKLKFREEKHETIFINQKKGKLNVNKLHNCVVNPDKIFYRKEISTYNDLNIHISVDASGSMGWGNKWDETIKMISILCTATSTLKGIRVQVSFRYSSRDNEVVLFYDSNVNDNKRIDLLKYVSPSGGTPEGLCFSALCDDVLNNLLNKNTLFINFSDGEPYGYAIDVTTKMIKHFKNKGMHIMSFFINDDNMNTNEIFKTFTEMYTEKDSFIVNSKELVKLSKILNKKFLSLGR